MPISGIADELRSVLTEAVSAHGVPGAAAGVLVDGETHTACVGVTSVENPLPVTPDTLFQIASITKTFVAAAVMRLVRDGRVALEDPVARHLPDLATRTGLDADAITLEHLLSHQSGFDGDHMLVGRLPERLEQLTDAARLHEPGEGVSYNNAAFCIAGELIARVSGDSFEHFIRDQVLKPLDIRGYFSADQVITRRVATPHFVVGDRVGVLRGPWQLNAIDRPAGGLITSVDGLLTWARAQLDPTEALDQDGIDRMQRPVATLDRWTRFGLDWSITRTNDTTVIDHGGLNPGYTSVLAIVPDRRVAVVSLTHATNGGAVNQAVRRWALRRFAEVEERDAESDPAVVVDADRFVGRYRYPYAWLTLTRGDAPNTLRVTPSERDDVDGWKPPPPPAVTLAFVDAEHAVTIDAGVQQRTRFGFDAAGRTAWMTWGSRRSPRDDLLDA